MLETLKERSYNWKVDMGATKYRRVILFKVDVNYCQRPMYLGRYFFLGFLEDDKEYIEAIREAKDWGYGHFLRKLFVTILISNSINKPEDVWANTWQWLSYVILYEQWRLTTIQGTKFKKYLNYIHHIPFLHLF